LGESIYPEGYKAARVAATLRKLLESSQVRVRCAEYRGRIDSSVALERTCNLIEELGRNTQRKTRQASA